MKVLFLMNSYNELPLLKVKHRYCIQQELDMFVIDNMSNDGTAEYLHENNIQHSFIDTNNCFDLRPLLKEMQRQLHINKPDWFIYHGMDVFPMTYAGIKQSIRAAELMGFNMISGTQFTFCNVGYKQTAANPFVGNYHYKITFTGAMICKYDSSVKITPDCILHPNPFIMNSELAYIETHVFNTPERRQEILERRQRAWGNDMPRNWGTHYQEEAHTGFITPIEKCKDVRDNKWLWDLYGRMFSL